MNKNQEQEFKNKCISTICNQLCPCCNRICGQEQAIHKYHKCLYGHQIRGITGIKLQNNEASVLRCEDVKEDNIIEFNGKDYTWAEFKNYYYNLQQNAWDLSETFNNKNDQLVKQFQTAWDKIGERICQDLQNKQINIKFVKYNQKTIEDQQLLQQQQQQQQQQLQQLSIHYIFLIDSSGSMGGLKWTQLLDSLKQSLGQISLSNKQNTVTIINFQSTALTQVFNQNPSLVNVNSLTFTGGGTDFTNALNEALVQMKRETQKSVYLIFMSDGGASYPTQSIANIKAYISSPQFSQRQKFQFSAIGFQCGSDIKQIEQLSKDLNGKSFSAQTGQQLTSVYKEIITNKT